MSYAYDVGIIEKSQFQTCACGVPITTIVIRLRVTCSPWTVFQLLLLLLLLPAVVVAAFSAVAGVDEKKEVEVVVDVGLAAGGIRKEENIVAPDAFILNVQLCVTAADSNRTPSIIPAVMVEEEVEEDLPDVRENKSIPFSLALITLKLSFPINVEREITFLP